MKTILKTFVALLMWTLLVLMYAALAVDTESWAMRFLAFLPFLFVGVSLQNKITE
jgi:hypothetical protein